MPANPASKTPFPRFPRGNHSARTGTKSCASYFPWVGRSLNAECSHPSETRRVFRGQSQLLGAAPSEGGQRSSSLLNTSEPLLGAHCPVNMLWLSCTTLLSSFNVAKAGKVSTGKKKKHGKFFFKNHSVAPGKSIWEQSSAVIPSN